MKYVIRYLDGAYEHTYGSGFPCSFDEARRFDTKEEANDHADMLIEVASIDEVPDAPQTYQQEK